MDSAMPHAILVIEDDPDIGSLVELHLSDAGHRVEVETSGTHGLERALSGDFELVILDLMLPGVDGLEICRRLRAEKHHIPILMLTSVTSKTNLDFSDRVGTALLPVDAFMEKPVRPGEPAPGTGRRVRVRQLFSVRGPALTTGPRCDPAIACARSSAG